MANPLEALLRLFEGWIDPFVATAQDDLEPPGNVAGYIWFYVRQAKWPFALLMVFGFANAIVEAALFWFVGDLVDILAVFDRQQGWSGLIGQHGTYLLFMVVVVALGRAVLIAVAALVEEQAVVPGFFTLMRWQNHLHVFRQSVAFFQDDLAGRIATKVFQSGHAAGDVMISLLQVIWFIAVYAITTLALLTMLDIRLGLLVALWIIIFVVLARLFVPRVRHHGELTAESASLVSGRLVDAYSNITTMKMNAAHCGEDGRMQADFRANQHALSRFTRVLTVMRVTLALTSGLFITAIATRSIGLWLGGELTTGAVAFTLALVLRLNLLLGRLMANLNGLFRNIGVAQNSMKLVARPLQLQDRPNASQFVAGPGTITFDKVEFSYRPNVPVIDNFSLNVSAGEKIGIVGPSGAGKSTLMSLLVRFRDVDNGDILVDGQNVRERTQTSLRAAFSLVQQETALMSRSVRENILFGKKEVGDDQVWAALEKVSAANFVATLKDTKGRRGLDSHIGERGIRLSGGERQRIALARVLIGKPAIVVLDEATSSLDSRTEMQVLRELLKYAHDHTMIVVAHRLSSVAALDRIIVMDNGAIVESGSHQKLLDRKGIYAQLWRRQSVGDEATDCADEAVPDNQ